MQWGVPETWNNTWFSLWQKELFAAATYRDAAPTWLRFITTQVDKTVFLHHWYFPHTAVTAFTVLWKTKILEEEKTHLFKDNA